MDNDKKANKGSTLQVLDSDVSIDPFGENAQGKRAYQRLERIVAATILLTNHLDATDTLRRTIRGVAMSTLPHLLAMRDDMRNLSSPKSIELLASVRHLITLIRLSVLNGSMSDQNGEILVRAIEDFNAFITASSRSPLSDAVAFSKEDFLPTRGEYKGHKRDIKDTASVKDISRVPTTTSARGDIILHILRDGKALSIKDIAMHLPEYGEKTIQRELAALTLAGFVNRVGLKRWSRYVLAAPV